MTGSLPSRASCPSGAPGSVAFGRLPLHAHVVLVPLHCPLPSPISPFLSLPFLALPVLSAALRCSVSLPLPGPFPAFFSALPSSSLSLPHSLCLSLCFSVSHSLLLSSSLSSFSHFCFPPVPLGFPPSLVLSLSLSLSLCLSLRPLSPCLPFPVLLCLCLSASRVFLSLSHVSLFLCSYGLRPPNPGPEKSLVRPVR